MKTLLAVLLAFCACHVMAQQPAQPPNVRVGETWQYRVLDGYSGEETDAVTMAVIRVSPDGFASNYESKVNGHAERTYTVERNPIQLSEGFAYKPFFPYFRFPMSVGNTWSAHASLDRASDSSHWDYDVESKVVSLEKVKVPAGEYEAYEIVSRTTYNGSKPGERGWGGRRMETMWYAPSVKGIVKSTYEDSLTAGSAGRPRKSTTELVSSRLQD
jgi:hypothetical protein